LGNNPPVAAGYMQLAVYDLRFIGV